MDKLKGLFGGQKPQIDRGIDKAADVVKDKVPDEHAAKVDAVADKAHEVVDQLADSAPAESAPADSAPAAPAPPVDPPPTGPADPEPAS
jgi:MT0933-like antitoxin protein